MATPIRGQTRPLPIKVGLLETQKLNANINASIHNRFDVEVIDTKTGKVRQRAHGENVICSQLWTRLFAPDTYFNYIHYGTGSGTPATANTSLFTFLGYGTPAIADDVITNTPASGIYAIRRKIVLNETTAVGATITEVGIGYGTSASTLCTHAMLKDENGNQISISKASTDIINIYATVFLHYSATGYDGGSIRLIAHGIGNYESINTYDGSGYIGYLPFLCGLYSGSYAYPPNQCDFEHGGYATTNIAVASISTSFNASAKTITSTASRLGASSGNAGGIEHIYLNTYGFPVIDITPTGAWMNGSNIVGESIGTGNGTARDFATSFPYASDGKVYVDGVEQTSGVNYTKDAVIAPIGTYLLPIDAQSASDNIIPAAGGSPNATSSNTTLAAGKTAYFYNPFWEIGISAHTFNSYTTAVYGSNDMSTWVAVPSGTISAENRHYKFWKLVANSSGSATWYNILTAGTGKSIHFDTAPASGAVITCDYHTKSIGKNANFVFNLTVTIQLGEYTA